MRERRPLGRVGAVVVILATVAVAALLAMCLFGGTFSARAMPTATPKPVSAMDGNDWRALDRREQRDLATRLLATLPQCTETPEWAVQNLDTFYGVDGTRGQKLDQTFATLLRVDGCR